MSPRKKKPPVPKKTVLFDADLLLHRFAHANQVQFQWHRNGDPKGELTTTTVAELEPACLEVADFIDHTMGTLPEADDYILVFSGNRNFRYDVLPTYKHNRKDKERPVLLDPLRDFLKGCGKWVMMPNLEGDDLMSLMATKDPGKFIICSIDKDMKQVPGDHYNWFTNQRSHIAEIDADGWFYTQILTGDPSDGYTGIPKIGPKKAAKILDGVDPGEWWGAVVAAYHDAGLTDADALQQARVARILRHPEYDFLKGEVKLWNPPQSFKSPSRSSAAALASGSR